MQNIYTNKRVLILGLGLNEGGVGSAKFFAKNGAEVKVTDLKDEKALKPSLEKLKEFKNISYTLGAHKFEDLDWADLIIKNPAIKPGNKFIEYAKEKQKQIETDLGIFLQFVKPSQIVGITGTKGKSTTSSLIYKLLQTSRGVCVVHLGCGLRSHLGNVILAGNIGTSVLEVIADINPDTLVVLELSSFQLEAFDEHQVSPHLAVITNIYKDHLNYYKTMDEYIKAKKVIAKYQTKDDFLFINKEDETLNNPQFLDNLKGKIVFYSKDDLPNIDPILKGDHNKSNLAAALAIGKIFNIDEKLLLNCLTQFSGVPFRMEVVKEWQGFKIYNDTTATNPSATIEGLKALGLDIVLICGGMNKGMDYQKMGEEINQRVDAVYFLQGDVVDEITCSIKDQSIIEGTFENLESLLTKLKKDIETNEYFKKGGSILFSPGATSFNMFQNEFDRGRQFNKAVEKIFT